MKTRIIHMICGPRNLSTAMMYSFAQRSDTRVIDEPFYAHYLNTTGMDHPGREEIIQSMSSDPEVVKNGWNKLDEKPYLLLKDMAHHLIQMDLTFMDRLTNFFLIRNPYQLIASFAQVIKQPTMQDIGLEKEWDLFQSISQIDGKSPVVLDTGDLVKDPETILKNLCRQLDLDFEPGMLSWPTGGRAEDGVWEKYWYKGVHNSTGFAERETSTRDLPDHCQELYEEALIYYNKLSEYAIKP